jgi:predicted acyl esterase
MSRFAVMLLIMALLAKGSAGAQIDPETVAKALEKCPEGTVHQHLMVPMRDGSRLATEIFTPPGDGPWPVVVLRTPYSRWLPDRCLSMMKGVPCVAVTQSLRGQYGSEGGDTLPRESFSNEVEDSYDTVEWIAKQDWCNGRVGMVGASGQGIAAMNALWANAPHLVAVDVNVSGDNAYLYWVYCNGVRRAMYRWLSNRSMRATDWPRPTTMSFDLEKREAFIAERAAKCKTVYITSTGWFDLFSEAALDHFPLLAHTGKVCVSISATGHGAIGGVELLKRSRSGGPRFPSFKEWMTGEATQGATRSMISYYLMGDADDPDAPGNTWKTTYTWPVEHTPTSFYMHRDGGLKNSPPAESDAFLTYTYDPRDPVASHGGHYAIGNKSGPYDQRPLKDRKDILRFATDPLSEPVGTTGKTWVELYVSSDAPDTTFMAKLIDVYPDGCEVLMRDSAVMARYWQGLDNPAPLEKGRVYKLRFSMWSTAVVFSKGHRIAVHISSSNSPAYEVHPNTYEPVMSMEKARVARNTVHLSKEYASRVILPVIPKESYMQ